MRGTSPLPCPALAVQPGRVELAEQAEVVGHHPDRGHQPSSDREHVDRADRDVASTGSVHSGSRRSSRAIMASSLYDGN